MYRPLTASLFTSLRVISSVHRSCGSRALRRPLPILYGGRAPTWICSYRHFITIPRLSKPTSSLSDDSQEELPSSTSATADEVRSPEELHVERALQTMKEDTLNPYDTCFHFVSDAAYTAPMVMLLGNHSSGKSTIINHLAGREIQETGVAPTDDGFTIIRRGAFDMDDDGPSAVSNPQYPFRALQPYGYNFSARFKVKTRRMGDDCPLPMNMMLVDTPGMIDTPVHVVDRSSLEGQLRGYDFLAVTRWFAERSDVILLLFDPANPGTTGETLDVLTKSLSGLEHKFLLVMNKVDVFDKVTDFARAYGTLCWNLSKVVHMKDIPRIFTTCTPAVARSARSSSSSSRLYPVPLEEIDRQRMEVFDEVLCAPLRRLDNLITETEESAKCVLLAGKIGSSIRRQYQQRAALVMIGLVVGGFILPSAAVLLLPLSPSMTVFATLGAILAASLEVVFAQKHLKQYELLLFDSCDAIMEQLFVGSEKTVEVQMRCRNVIKPEIVKLGLSRRSIGQSAISELPKLSRRAERCLMHAIYTEIPSLRALVAEHKKKEYRKRWERAQTTNK